MKIGVIVGQGDLPLSVIAGAKEAGQDIFVARVHGHASIDTYPGTESFNLAEVGKLSKALKRNDCTHICFAGYVDRPDFLKLRPDFKGIQKLPGAIQAAKKGDNALLTYLLQVYEEEGFEIISPQQVCESILMPSGFLGAITLQTAHRNDTEKACKIARIMGEQDIGQGAVVCRGLVLAVEAQEGTDDMLRRVAALPKEIRGTITERAGVLAKMVKPGQDTRVDLPTIGSETVQLVAEAGLAGIAVEAALAFVINREEVIEAANKAGIFVLGLPPMES